MNVGDLVRACKQGPHRGAMGVIIEIKILPLRDILYGVLWSFMPDQLGWQYRGDIEVVNEGR